MIKILQITIFYVCGQPTTTIIAPFALGGPGQGNRAALSRRLQVFLYRYRLTGLIIPVSLYL